MNSIDSRMKQIQQLCATGAFSAAKEMLRALCQEMPENVNAWHLLGGVNGHLGDFEDAAECSRKVIALAPGIPEGHSNLGVALLNLEQPMEAQAAFQKALSLQPDRPRDHNNLGLSLSAQSRFDQAAASFEKAIALDGRFADAYQNLGGAYQELGLYDKALENFECAVRLAQGVVKYLISLGFALLRAGQHERAVWCANQVLQQDSCNVNGIRLKGAVYADMHQYLGAIAEYKRSIQLQPDQADLYLALGKVHLSNGVYDEAMDCFLKAKIITPENIEIRYNIALCLEAQGDLDAAQAQYRDVISISAEHVDSVCGLARIFEKQDDFDNALDLLTRLLDQGQVTTRVLEAYTSICRRFGLCTEAARQIELYLESNSITNKEESKLRFLLGMLYDRNLQYDAAFTQYKAANALKRVTYNIAADEKITESIVREFTAETFQKIPEVHGNADVIPIFIIGMPRSGSTLVEQILASHPDVYAGDELPFIGDIMSAVELHGETRRWPEYVSSLDEKTCAGLAEEYLRRLRELAPGYRYITDKMPHNFPYLGLIRKLFPDARLIYTKRNPVDTCLSCYFQNFLAAHEYAFDLLSVGKHYRLHEKIMEHYLDVLNLPVFEVQYENTVKCLEESVRSLLDYCGLEWNDACLRYNESSRRSITASYDQIRQPLYKHSIERWRHYEKHIGVLLDVLNSSD